MWELKPYFYPSDGGFKKRKEKEVTIHHDPDNRDPNPPLGVVGQDLYTHVANRLPLKTLQGRFRPPEGEVTLQRALGFWRACAFAI